MYSLHPFMEHYIIYGCFNLMHDNLSLAAVLKMDKSI